MMADEPVYGVGEQSGIRYLFTAGPKAGTYTERHDKRLILNERTAAYFEEHFGWVEGRDFLLSPDLPEDFDDLPPL